MRDKAPAREIDDDIHLMLKVKQGDHQAYTRLYEKYVPAVRRYFARRGRSAWQDDMVQEVFVRLWQARTRYEPLAPVKSYLLGIAANVLRESRARRSPVPIDTCELETITDRHRHAPPVQVQSAEQLQAMYDLVKRLPPRQRQAVELICLAGLTHEEAAQQLGCSVAALDSYLCEARGRVGYHTEPLK